jgi:phage anti-repressor protein
MNQIVPKTINFAELAKNSQTTLSLDFESKLVEHLNKEFTDHEQQWYIANLFVYMNYHPTNDYPINLEHVYKMIGFAHKKNAKRTLENNFIKNDDYKVTVLPREHGKFSEEIVMLNTDTFKNMCMMAKTEKGKEIRRYYVKLENIYNTLVRDEMDQNTKRLEESKQLLLEKEKELEETKKQVESRLKQKKWYDCEPGHTVYAYKSNEESMSSLITIGKSKNIKRRESEYMTHNQDGKMFYIRKCYNCDLTEKVLHHILGKYRCENNREWFEITDKIAIYIIDLVCDFLDSFIGCIERLPEFEIGEYIKSLDINEINYKVTLDDHIVFQNVQVHVPDIDINPDIKDYEKFMRDCCDVGEEWYSLPSEVISAYRVWCKGAMTRTTRNELDRYIKSKFQKKDMYLEHLGIRSSLLIGIKPKELIFEPNDTNNPSSFEQFCMDECVTNYSYKVKFEELFKCYQTMGKSCNEDSIKTSLSKQFLVEYYSSVCYVWGIQLKSSPLPTYRSSTNTCNKIYQIDLDTKEVIGILYGLSEASLKFSMLPEVISNRIRYKKPFEVRGKTVLLVYDKPNLEHVGIKRNVQHKTIYKFDIDSKTIVESYKTICEAGKQNGLSTKTISRYIKVQQIFKTKKDGNVAFLLTYKDVIDDETVAKIKQLEIENKKSGVTRIRPCKIIEKVEYETNRVVDTYYGILDASTNLHIGECTVSRHLKSGKKLKIKYNNTFIVLRYKSAENVSTET